MHNIGKKIEHIINIINNKAKLVAVTKTKPIEDLMEAYNSGFKRFGENKVQELCSKYESLPKDIEWHMIGHLQSNKVKNIAPFVKLIHGVDSFKLLKEINKESKKNNRVIDCLLQIYIADEETKFGLSFDEASDILNSEAFSQLENIRIIGLMGMATFTDDKNQIRSEFKALKSYFDTIKSSTKHNVALSEISMGMSGDFELAIEEGSTMIRVGSAIFGNR